MMAHKTIEDGNLPMPLILELNLEQVLFEQEFRAEVLVAVYGKDN
jgi:hypothetical protein